MEFVPSLVEWKLDRVPSAVTIGMFDGLHLGHQALLRMLSEGARAEGLRTIVLTFDQHPRLALTGSPSEGSITTLEEKRELLAAMGIDVCGLIRVQDGLLSLEAEEFVRQYLVDRLATRLVVIGYDFRFGRQRRGDFQMLRSMGSQYGFDVKQSAPVVIGSKPVKSTLIRDDLKAGDLASAVELLGRPYSVVGEVVKGKQLGRQLGFPTVNIQPSAEKLLPAPGIYTGSCQVEGKEWPAAINLGTRPTVSGGGEAKVLLEAHLPGFDGNVYGETVKLEFAGRLRGEERFPSLEALKEQIRQDVEETVRWYEKR